jgi:tetratricopeptide (TPR) repeat protein
MLAYRQGEYQEVGRLCQQALEMSQALGEKGAVAFALHYLAHVAQEQGRYDEAEEMMTRSMTLFHAQGSAWGQAESLNCLGDLQRQRGRYDEATTMLKEALRLRRGLNNQRGTAATLCNLGHALCRQNDAQGATACFREGLEIAEALHNRLFRMNCLVGFADIASVEGKAERSALLLGAACHLLGAEGYELEPPDRENYDLLVDQVRHRLEEGVYEAVWEQGGQMSLEQALAYALAGAGV